MAKRNNVWMGLDCARMGRDILGGNGIADEHLIFRHMANLESVKTYERDHHTDQRIRHTLSLKAPVIEYERERAAFITKVTTILPNLHGSQRGLLRAAMSGQNVGRFGAHFSQYFRNPNNLLEDIASPNCLN
jgi:hypothetical protein